MEDKNIYNFTLEVESEERIDKLLAGHFLEYSRSTIQKWISEKNVKINNIATDKMIKRQNGYFINPLSFKDIGGSDIFFVSVLEKI